MANRRDIKRRIGSVINTQKITKALKLVAAAKFARASHAVNAARPYSRAFDDMVSRLVASTEGNIDTPILRVPEEKKALVVVLGTDRGLCGGLNTNLFRTVRAWVNEKLRQNPQVSFSYYAWGRKASSWSRKQAETLYGSKEKVLDRPTYQGAKNLTEELVGLFLSGDYDAIYLANSQFLNALTQKPQVTKLLPIAAADLKSDEKLKGVADVIVEPSLSQMLEKLLQRKLSALVFQATLDGAASEQGSRMTAMDNATTNAGEVRKKLVLKYNRVRQAAITKELIEIISGAEAL